MVDTKISGLTAGTPGTADTFPFQRGGTNNFKSTPQAMELSSIYGQVVGTPLATDTLPFQRGGTNVWQGTFSNNIAGKIYSSNGTVYPVGTLANTQYLQVSGGSIISSAVSGGGVGQNDVINGEMRIAQRGTSFTAATVPINSDGTKLLDRWILLSEGNDIVDVTQSTVAPAGFTNSAKLEVETANKQFGFLHIIENKDAIKYAGGVASLQFQARMAAADDNTHSLKAVLLSWSGTADAPTIDVVNAWGATPTYVANWTAENSPASLTLTTSFQTFEIENIPVDTASMANLAIFIFCDQTDGAVDDAIYLSAVKLENGATCTDFVSRPIGQEQSLCERECEVISSATDGGAATYGVAQCASTTRALNSLRFRTLKRKIPTVTLSAVGDWAFYDNAISAFKPWTSYSVNSTEAGCHFDVTCSGAGLGGAGQATLMAPNASTTAARIYIECGF